MLNAERILKSFEENGISFFTGVPDSQLKALCNCLMNTYGISDKHVIAANEGIFPATIWQPGRFPVFICRTAGSAIL